MNALKSCLVSLGLSSLALCACSSAPPDDVDGLEQNASWSDQRGYVYCGGLAGTPCYKGQLCIDYPNDGCDPNNGWSDCIGICAEKTGAICAGLKGAVCPKGELCVDNPEDNCDPASGGADCIGQCTHPVTGGDGPAASTLTSAGGSGADDWYIFTIRNRGTSP